MIQPHFDASPSLIISEDDVRRLFLRGQNRQFILPSSLTRIWQGIGLILVLGALVYVTLNAPALWQWATFNFHSSYQSSNQSQGEAPPIPVPGQTSTPTAAPASEYVNDHLYIKRIGVDVPVIWNVADDNQSVMKNLENGVVHLKGQATPDQIGNIFIVGHSSNYIFAPGKYKHVFALLPQLKTGDEIVLVYQGTAYHYRVKELKVVKPEDGSIRTATNQQILSLMTCVPIGTTLNRLDVIAVPENPPVLNSPQLPATQ